MMCTRLNVTVLQRATRVRLALGRWCGVLTDLWCVSSEKGLGRLQTTSQSIEHFILGLRGALDRGIYRVRVQGDSNLVCEQVLGRWKVNQPTLAILCKEAQRSIGHFSEFSVRHVDREVILAADKLANEAVLLPETKFVSSLKELRAGKAEAAFVGSQLATMQGR